MGIAVYPRACGGTRAFTLRTRTCMGLSPRVRGNLVRESISPDMSRSIPARAGEPRSLALSRFGYWVYPRACGGTCVAFQRVE